MSTTTAKRPLDIVNSPASVKHEVDEEESNDSSEAKRRVNRPGRKPLDVEAKNKRTAQNRAAQRAFRERKEKKMKELEEKVRDLEEMNQQSVVESEFLRSQLLTLVNELKKYRPSNDTDSQVLDYLAKHERRSSGKDDVGVELLEPDQREIEANIQKKMDFTFAFPWKGRKDKDATQFPSPGSSMISSSSASISSSSSTARRRGTIASSENGTGSNKNSMALTLNNTSGTPGSTSTSTGWMDNVFYTDDAQQLPQFASDALTHRNDAASIPLSYDSTLFSNQFNFDDQFDEQVSQFCSKMNQACGTKECPIPTNQAPTVTPKSIGSAEAVEAGGLPVLASPNVLANTWDAATSPVFGQASISPAKIDTTKLSNEFPIDSSREGNLLYKDDDETRSKPVPLPFIDPSMAFPNEDDQGLFFRDAQSENNILAEFLDENDANDQTENFVNNNLINEEPAIKDNEQNEYILDKSAAKPAGATPPEDVVPSRDGKLLKCSEVWDRITAHPKYTTIDIDGLCQELMTKAKCSDKGVVVKADDVQRVLHRHMDND